MPAPTMPFAQGPFDGTWERIPGQSKFSSKPIVFSVNDGLCDTLDLCSCSTR
jgi:hypothetical protein